MLEHNSRRRLRRYVGDKPRYVGDRHQQTDLVPFIKVVLGLHLLGWLIVVIAILIDIIRGAAA